MNKYNIKRFEKKYKYYTNFKQKRNNVYQIQFEPYIFFMNTGYVNYISRYFWNFLVKIRTMNL